MTDLWAYWGKADPAFEGQHHAAVLHCLDVAACAWVLVVRDAVLMRKIAGSLGLTLEQAVATTAYFCALHDIGKFDVRFQVKAPEHAERLMPGLTTRVRRVPYDHGGEGFRQLYSDLELDALCGKGGQSLLQAVCGHHGTIPGPEGLSRDLPAAEKANDAAARVAVIDAFTSLFHSRGAVSRLPRLPAASQQLVAGVCAVADWVGSNTEWFPYNSGPVDLATYFDGALERAATALEAAGLVPRPVASTSFADLFPGYSPRGVQTLTEQLGGDAPALIVVEAEMGQGKTEAALSLASRFLAAGEASGIYVGLPTMATSNAMFSRVDDLVPRLLQTSDEAPAHVALAHGQARKNTRFQQRFRERPLQSARYDDEASVVCARWLLGRKRALLAQVGVGTIDQALQAVLRVHHQFVRLTALARDVVIVDEVHAYDAYMESLLESAVRWWGALGVPVILLSATLPAERRARLVAAWRGDPIDDELVIADGPSAQGASYPLVTEARHGQPTRVWALPTDVVQHQRRISLDLRRDPVGDADLGPIVDEIIAAAQAGARVAWVRNTVGDAQDAWRLLRKRAAAADVQATMFHARFRGTDRRRIESDVLSSFGKGALPGGRIVLATQVIEQSLDLDFDWLVSDLAPVDLLLQRMGRLHRHERTRGPAWATPRLTVRIGSDDDAAAVRFGPSAFVYDGPTLWLARQALVGADAGWQVPHDIRPLVEATYHPALRAGALNTARLQELEGKRLAEVGVRATNAQKVVIAAASGEGVGATVSDDDETVQALTRDGRSHTILPLWWEDDEARTLDGATLNLDATSAWAWKTLDALGDETLSYSTCAPVTSTLPHGEPAAWEDFIRRFATFAKNTALGRVVLLPMRRVALADDGAVFRGALRIGQRRKSVLYSRTLGLHLVKESP